MYEWFWGIFAKKSKLHDAGGPDTVVSPNTIFNNNICLHMETKNKYKIVLDCFINFSIPY